MADTPRYSFEVREDLFSPATKQLLARHTNFAALMDTFDLNRHEMSDSLKRHLSFTYLDTRPDRPPAPKKPPSTGILQLVVPLQDRVLWKVVHDSWHFYNEQFGDVNVPFYLHDRQRTAREISRWELTIVPLHDWGRRKRDVTFQYLATIAD